MTHWVAIANMQRAQKIYAVFSKAQKVTEQATVHVVLKTIAKAVRSRPVHCTVCRAIVRLLRCNELSSAILHSPHVTLWHFSHSVVIYLQIPRT